MPDDGQENSRRLTTNERAGQTRKEVRRLIALRVEYERWPAHGRSLEWIAPELRDAPLKLLEDHADDERATRTWCGIIDDAAFERFAQAWRLRRDTGDPEHLIANIDRHRRLRSYVFDGMNWESGGVSPIISVTVLVLDLDRAAVECEGARGELGVTAPVRQAFR